MSRWEDHVFAVLAYGDSPFLVGCLHSLSKQTLPGRVIVTTSTPSDFIARTAQEAGAEMHINPKREGIGADWNFALSAADRRYVTLVHQDDVYYPDFLLRTHQLFTRYPSGALAFTGFQEIDDRGQPRRSRVSIVKHGLSRLFLGRSECPDSRSIRLFLSFGNPLPCSSVTYDLQKIPDFRFSTALASNLDWDAWLRLNTQAKSFLHAPERLIGWRRNAMTETSRLIRDGRRQQEDADIFGRIWPGPVARLLTLLHRAAY